MTSDSPNTADIVEMQCDGCGDWHPEYLFNDEATELCDHCMDEWEADNQRFEKARATLAKVTKP